MAFAPDRSDDSAMENRDLCFAKLDVQIETQITARQQTTRPTPPAPPPAWSMAARRGAQGNHAMRPAATPTPSPVQGRFLAKGPRAACVLRSMLPVPTKNSDGFAIIGLDFIRRSLLRIGTCGDGVGSPIIHPFPNQADQGLLDPTLNGCKLGLMADSNIVARTEPADFRVISLRLSY